MYVTTKDHYKLKTIIKVWTIVNDWKEWTEAVLTASR